MSAETIGDIGFTGKMKGGKSAVPSLTPDVIRDPSMPAVSKFVKPEFYAPRASDLQKAAFNPRSTSHGYLQKFGYAKSF